MRKTSLARQALSIALGSALVVAPSAQAFADTHGSSASGAHPQHEGAATHGASSAADGGRVARLVRNSPAGRWYGARSPRARRALRVAGSVATLGLGVVAYRAMTRTSRVKDHLALGAGVLSASTFAAGWGAALKATHSGPTGMFAPENVLNLGLTGVLVSGAGLAYVSAKNYRALRGSRGGADAPTADAGPSRAAKRTESRAASAAKRQARVLRAKAFRQRNARRAKIALASTLAVSALATGGYFAYGAMSGPSDDELRVSPRSASEQAQLLSDKLNDISAQNWDNSVSAYEDATAIALSPSATAAQRHQVLALGDSLVEQNFPTARERYKDSYRTQVITSQDVLALHDGTRPDSAIEQEFRVELANIDAQDWESSVESYEKAVDIASRPDAPAGMKTEAARLGRTLLARNFPGARPSYLDDYTARVDTALARLQVPESAAPALAGSHR